MEEVKTNCQSNEQKEIIITTQKPLKVDKRLRWTVEVKDEVPKFVG